MKSIVKGLLFHGTKGENLESILKNGLTIAQRPKIGASQHFSQYHFDAFFDELPNFLKGFPDNNELKSVSEIKRKSSVLYLGMDLKKLDAGQKVCIEKDEWQLLED